MAAVGEKVVEIVERDGLAERARELGDHLKARLLNLQQRHTIIGDVRGRNVEMMEDKTTTLDPACPQNSTQSVPSDF